MGLFSKPPSLISPDKKEVEEFRSIVGGLADRFPRATKAIDGLLSESGLRLSKEEGLSLTRKAIKILETASKEHPKSFVLPFRLCDLYMDVDRFADALATAKEMVIGFPSDPRSWYALATVYHTLGRVRETELGPETREAMRSPYLRMVMLNQGLVVASEAIEEACEKLALTPMQASELAAQYFRRTLELGVRRAERPHVEECVTAALIHYRNRKLGIPLTP
jgi:tetratricopeptide (TPR) repeat protein